MIRRGTDDGINYPCDLQHVLVGWLSDYQTLIGVMVKYQLNLGNSSVSVRRFDWSTMMGNFFGWMQGIQLITNAKLRSEIKRKMNRRHSFNAVSVESIMLCQPNKGWKRSSMFRK